MWPFDKLIFLSVSSSFHPSWPEKSLDHSEMLERGSGAAASYKAATDRKRWRHLMLIQLAAWPRPE
jgi:hypothetical protein